jgi:RNA polymerase sigma-70 factor (sigma-E family)
MDAAALIAPPFSLAGVVPIGAAVAAGATAVDSTDDEFIVAMFQEHGLGLVRMVRMFVDDRNAAEDLVQEAFIRLARSSHRIEDGSKAAAYLRSIVLNLARDHNRRGLVSLRHHLPSDPLRASVEDTIELREDQQMVIDALRELPQRQRDCLILRYYDELPVPEIGEALGISANSVKTHLKRGLRSLEAKLDVPEVAGRAAMNEATVSGAGAS